MKIRKLEITYGSDNRFGDNLPHETKTFHNVKCRLTKPLIKEIVESCDKSELDELFEAAASKLQELRIEELEKLGKSIENLTKS